MQHEENSNIYVAEDGNFIIRTEDAFIMGEDICLGSADSIDNYSEEAYTKQSYLEFYVSCGYSEDEAKRRWNDGHPDDPWEIGTTNTNI